MSYKPKYIRKPRILPRLLSIATLLFTGLLVVALVMVTRDMLRSRQEQEAFRDLAQLVQDQKTQPTQAPQPIDGTTPATEAPSPYQVLRDQNPDFVAWLTVPGTSIDYPVVHTPDDIEHYIYRDFSGAESPSGTPFVGDYGAVNDQKCIIYGHNMKDGTMFHDLLRYEKQAFWEENQTFTIHTLDGERTYEIFASVKTRVLSTDESGFRFYRLGEGLEAWLVENSLYHTGITPENGEQIVLLSTCSYHTDEGRFLIAGRLVETPAS